MLLKKQPIIEEAIRTFCHPPKGRGGSQTDYRISKRGTGVEAEEWHNSFEDILFK